MDPAAEWAELAARLEAARIDADEAAAKRDALVMAERMAFRKLPPRGWAALPADLLQHIYDVALVRSTPAGVCAFVRVCRTWSRAVCLRVRVYTLPGVDRTYMKHCLRGSTLLLTSRPRWCATDMFDVRTGRAICIPTDVQQKRHCDVELSPDGSVYCICMGTEWRDVATQRLLVAALNDSGMYVACFDVAGCVLRKSDRPPHKHYFVDVRDPVRARVFDVNLKMEGASHYVLTDDTRHLFYVDVDKGLMIASDDGTLKCGYDLTNATVMGAWSERGGGITAVVLRPKQVEFVRVDPATGNHAVEREIRDVELLESFRGHSFKSVVSPDRRVAAWWSFKIKHVCVVSDARAFREVCVVFRPYDHVCGVSFDAGGDMHVLLSKGLTVVTYPRDTLFGLSKK